MTRVTTLAVRTMAIIVAAGTLAVVAWAFVAGDPNVVGAALFGAMAVAAAVGSVGLWVDDVRLAALGAVLLAVLAQGQAAVGPFMLGAAVLLAAGTGVRWGTGGTDSAEPILD